MLIEHSLLAAMNNIEEVCMQGMNVVLETQQTLSQHVSWTQWQRMGWLLMCLDPSVECFPVLMLDTCTSLPNGTFLTFLSSTLRKYNDTVFKPTGICYPVKFLC